MLVDADLADSIRSTMGFPTPVSVQLSGWAKGVLDEIRNNAVTANSVGNVAGTCPGSGGALTDGQAFSGTISGMSATSMASRVRTAAGYPSISFELNTFCVQIVNHIQLFGIVAFASGNITGNCTNDGLSPGDLTNGAGTNGTISGLDGISLATGIHTAVGYPGSTSVRLTQFCVSIVNYIMLNAAVTYASGQVTGFAPAAGGALVNGTATDGTIA